MKTLKLALPIVLLTAGSAYADPSTEMHSEHVDAAGTAVKTDTESSASINLLGTKKTEKESKTVIDPKGLGNKTVVTSEEKTSMNRKGDTTRQVQSVDSQGTGRETEVTQKTSGNWLNDGSTTKVTATAKVDPKGLGNKHEVKAEEKIERDAAGNVVKRSITKEVDGDKVAEEVREVR